jgi:hypothetical protein
MDGDGDDEIMGSFNDGLWSLRNWPASLRWTLLSVFQIPPISIAVADLDRNGKDELAVTYPSGSVLEGVWAGWRTDSDRDHDRAAWRSITGAFADRLVSGSFN